MREYKLRNAHQLHTYLTIKISDTTKNIYCKFLEEQNNNNSNNNNNNKDEKFPDLEKVGLDVFMKKYTKKGGISLS